MKPDDLLCSCNARSRKTLVGHAQWKINQPPSLKRERGEHGKESLDRKTRCTIVEPVSDGLSGCNQIVGGLFNQLRRAICVKLQSSR
jgi:hypothetical protein